MKILKVLGILLMLTPSVKAQIKIPSFSPEATVAQSVGLSKVTITYGRPSMRGRKIFGETLPYGVAWRTGANAATNIKFDKDLVSAYVQIAWENTAVKFKIEHDNDAEIKAQILKVMAGSPTVNDYIYAGEYYNDNNFDLPRAYEWIGKALEKSPQFWLYGVRAEIAHKMGDCKKALPDAQRCYDEAMKNGDIGYRKISEKVLKECKDK